MQNYINQLLIELDELINHNESIGVANSMLLVETESSDDLLELSKLYIGPEHSFADLLGIQLDALPPSERLSDQQATQLLESIENALMIHQCFLDFPNNIVDRKKYSILRSYWNEPQLICSNSVNTIDFCDYDQENCVYGPEGCECKHLEGLG